jgi:hypothetical protein
MCASRLGRFSKFMDASSDFEPMSKDLPATRQLGLSRSVLYDLLRRYKQRPQTSSLLPWKRGREAKAKFLDSTREELLNSSIQDFYFYMRLERPSLAALLLEVRRRFSEQNLPAPHYRTVLDGLRRSTGGSPCRSAKELRKRERS